MIQAIKQVIAFELMRTVTRSRLAVWIAIIVCPTLLMGLLQFQARHAISPEPLVTVAFFLVVQIGCMMGLLLWATPSVGSEIEAQTWVYIAMRPHGRVALVVGKYIVAVVWAVLAGLPSAVGVALATGIDVQWQLAATLCGLVILASLCYAALYSLIGVVFSRRATVFAVVYSLVMEMVVASIPATVNQLTVSYRLRSLLVDWTGIESLRTAAERMFGSSPAWQNLLGLAIYLVVTLGLAAFLIHRKEFSGEATSA